MTPDKPGLEKVARPRNPRRHLVAALAAAAVPAAIGGLIAVLWPAGCDIRGDPAVYRWTCLLPGMLFFTPSAIATVLFLAAMVSRRIASWFETRGVRSVFAIAVLSQIVMMGGYALAMEPAYRRLFLFEAVVIPQPFVVGAITAAVYCTALVLIRRRAP